MILLTTLLALSAQPATDSLYVSVTPVSVSTVAKGASRVPLLHMNIEAPCHLEKPAVIQSIDVRHAGKGDSSDLLGVYVLEHRTRLSRRQTIERRFGTATVRLRTFSLSPCTKRQIQIVADISPDAASAGEHSVSLQSLMAVSGSEKLAVVVANTKMPSVSRVAPVSADAPAFELREIRQRIVYGSQRIVSRFLLSADDDAIDISALTLTNDGKAEGSDLQNLSIVDASGKRLTAVLESMDGDIARFVFDPPLRLERNQDKLLEVKADFHVSIRKTVRFELEESSDIEWQKAGR